MKMKLSFDEYSILRYLKHVDEKVFISFDNIVDYIFVYRDKVEELLNRLITKELIQKDKYTNRGPILYELEQYCFKNKLTNQEIKNKIKRPCFWGVRRIFLKIYRKALRYISIKIDTIDMFRKNKQRIKKAGLKKQKAHQKRWAKSILKTKNLDVIIYEIEENGFFVDKEETIRSCLLGDLCYTGIFIIVGKENSWAIEINSKLPNLEQYEYLTLYTPTGKGFYFVREVS